MTNTTNKTIIVSFTCFLRKIIKPTKTNNIYRATNTNQRQHYYINYLYIRIYYILVIEKFRHVGLLVCWSVFSELFKTLLCISFFLI